MARTRAEGLATGAKPWTPAKAVAAIASMENFMVYKLMYDKEMVPRFVIVRDARMKAAGACSLPRVFWREMSHVALY